MKKLIAFSLLLIQLFIMSSIAVYADGPKNGDTLETVRLGYFDFQDYMMGAEEGTQKSGFVYDLLCEVAAINHWKYEFVYGDFNDLYAELLRGNIDILPCLVYTEERAQNHLFSDEEIYAEQYFISVLNENAAKVHSIRDLDGKTLSTVTDTHQNEAFSEWAAAQGISMELLCTGSYEDSWNQLENGTADYILNIDSAAQDSGYTSLFEVGSGSSRFAIAPGREDIREEMNRAIDTIYDINPFTISHLKEKYLTDTLSSYILSEEELEWLSGRDVIQIAGFADNIPYTYHDKNGTVTGVYPDIVDTMFRKLGITARTEWILYDSEDAMHQALQGGAVDLVCPYYYGHYYAQADNMIISEKIHNANMGLLCSEKMNEGNVRRIAVPDSFLNIHYAEDTYPEAEIICFDTVKECIDSVSAGKSDAAIAHITLLENESAKKFENFHISIPSVGCPVCFSSRPEDGMLICIINRGLHLISEDELQALEMKHTPETDNPLWEYFKKNKLLVGAALLALFAIVFYAFERSAFSRKLEKNLSEITKQKEIIEDNEKKLKVATEAANAANQAKSAFLLNMSHDIRTPMNAILGYTGIARKNTREPETDDYLAKIEIAGKQLLSLVNQVLEMSRIESGKIVLQEQKIDMEEGANVVRTVYADQAKAKGLDLAVEVRNLEHRYAIGDNDRISQITNNLIGNAIKYTREGGSIITYVEEEPCDRPGYAIYRLVVEDTGIGMSEEYLPHLFEEFTREQTSTVSRIQGTGLGMPIVKKLVDLMNGTIDVTSKLGAGSRFVVRLPLKIDTDPGDSSEGTIATEEISLEGMKILLVEDNEMNREIAEEILTEVGARVDMAEDGVEAVEKVKNSVPGQYDVVLMDIQMPRMNGYEACGKIRALDNKELSEITIIAMTANVFAEDRQKALEAGMNGHLAKPIDIPKLLATLSELKKENQQKDFR